MLKRRLLMMLFVFVAATRCASSGTGLNIYSYEQEAEEGDKFAVQIEHESPIMNDPVLNRYIANLGARMISQGVDDPHFNYKFKVVNSSEVNAFAIPGGHLYVNLALLKEAQSESELVGVVGHEIGHVVHRHGTKRMTDAQLLEIVSSLGEEAGGKAGGVFAALFGNLGLLKYGRNAELEADHSGVDILYRTGYDVQALPGFFNKLLEIEKKYGVQRGGLSELLATHPPTSDRINLANEYIATLPKQNNPKINSPEFEELKRYIAPMTPLKPRRT